MSFAPVSLGLMDGVDVVRGGSVRYGPQNKAASSSTSRPAALLKSFSRACQRAAAIRPISHAVFAQETASLMRGVTARGKTCHQGLEGGSAYRPGYWGAALCKVCSCMATTSMWTRAFAKPALMKRGAIFGANSLRYLSTFLFALCAKELHLRQKQPA